MLTKKKAIISIKNHFGHILTKDQAIAVTHLAAFAVSLKSNPMYLLKGYAGTGKTSLISAFVKMLYQEKKHFVLMAPTGRAAKVLSQYTGFSTSTIHRRLYLFVNENDGVTRMICSKNKMENTFFIVDEASMISDNRQDEGLYAYDNNLLDDLMNYVFSGAGNRLLFVGDTAQLPPVGMDLSPALNIEYLQTTFNLTAYSFEMKEVMRQSLNSGILSSATIIRNKITDKNYTPPFFQSTAFKNDVKIVERADTFEELLQDAFYDSDKTEKSIIVCRSNKRANMFNKQVRNRILQRENNLDAGDRIMIVKNNYFWLNNNSGNGFIANGDIAEITRVVKTENFYGFSFADVEIKLIDYPELNEINVKLILNGIDADGPTISIESQKKLFENILEDYSGISSRKKQIAEIKKNPYFNALQVKFAYAMTCHKTQGGQWPFVFIDQGYITDEMINIEYLRWLYTAFTRATQKVFLVNFQTSFFKQE